MGRFSLPFHPLLFCVEELKISSFCHKYFFKFISYTIFIMDLNIIYTLICVLTQILYSSGNPIDLKKFLGSLFSDGHGRVQKIDHHAQHFIYTDNQNNQDDAQIIPDTHRMANIPINEANSNALEKIDRNAQFLIFTNNRKNEVMPNGKLRPGLRPRGSGPEGMFLGNLFVLDEDSDSI